MMEPLTILDEAAAPLDQPGIDTGLLMPARFVRRPRKEGYQDFLLHDLRFRDDGSEIPDFILNREPFRRARILVADQNFGIGSSREQAVWGLLDYGIRCVIAVDFGEIFSLNCVKNGILLVQLGTEACAELRRGLHAQPGARLVVDLPEQTVIGPDVRYARDPLAGLSEKGQRGAVPKYGAEHGKRILALPDQPPPKGYAIWTAPLALEREGRSAGRRDFERRVALPARPAGSATRRVSRMPARRWPASRLPGMCLRHHQRPASRPQASGSDIGRRRRAADPDSGVACSVARRQV